MYEAGRYKAVVTGQFLGESKKKKTPQFVLTIRPEHIVIDGEDHQVDAMDDRCIYFYLSEGAVERSVKDLQSLGFNRESFGELDPDCGDFFDFRNLMLDVTCEHEEYEGKRQERWTLADRSTPVAKLDPQSVRKLDALFGKHLKVASQIKPPSRNGGPAKPPASTVAAAPNRKLDDSIPF